MASKTTYRVIGPVVLPKLESGATTEVYQGGVVPEGQTEQWIKDHLEMKLIAKESDAEKELAAQPAGEPEPAKK